VDDACRAHRRGGHALAEEADVDRGRTNGLIDATQRSAEIGMETKSGMCSRRVLLADEALSPVHSVPVRPVTRPVTPDGSRNIVCVSPEEIGDLAHLRRARDLIDRDYAQPLDVPAMARAALMSPAHFSRKFRAAYGETPYSYLMTRRIERAKALLRQGMSVTDACVTVGCTSLGSFSSRFTEIVGETPSQYRARDHSYLELVPSCVTMVVTRPRRTLAV
jgi:AraC-like DNA-binding protein